MAAIGAIKASEEDEPPDDAVIFDMDMPHLDGYGTIKWLRDDGFRRPLLAVTASTMQQDRERCIAASCDGYISKPINRESLITELVRLIERHG